MKRHKLDRWLGQHGCHLVREGARHSWFENAAKRDLFRVGNPRVLQR